MHMHLNDDNSDTQSNQGIHAVRINEQHIKFEKICCRIYFLIIIASIVNMIFAGYNNVSPIYIVVYVIYIYGSYLHTISSICNMGAYLEVLDANDIGCVTLGEYNMILKNIIDKETLQYLNFKDHVKIITFICCFFVKNQFWLISFIILTVVDCARVICGWLYECNNPKYVILSRVAEEQTNISVLDSIDNILQKYTIAQYTSDVTGECAVCLNDFDESNELIKLNCDHIFHLECIANWNRIQSTCPSCRNEYLQSGNSVNSTDATTATISTDTTDMTNSTDTAANNV